MRFGKRLGPFWFTTPTRQLRRGMAEREQRIAEIRRMAGMSPEEYCRSADADPVYWDWFHRQDPATEAEPRRLRDELGEGGRSGAG
jgi:hypothetical protein